MMSANSFTFSCEFTALVFTGLFVSLVKVFLSDREKPDLRQEQRGIPSLCDPLPAAASSGESRRQRIWNEICEL